MIQKTFLKKLIVRLYIPQTIKNKFTLINRMVITDISKKCYTNLISTNITKNTILYLLNLSINIIF